MQACMGHGGLSGESCKGRAACHLGMQPTRERLAISIPELYIGKKEQLMGLPIRLPPSHAHHPHPLLHSVRLGGGALECLLDSRASGKVMERAERHE